MAGGSSLFYCGNGQAGGGGPGRFGCVPILSGLAAL
jgi:hypothetical protein